jgi:ubiquinone/menaquinone biosynthesis C-methylase UbiE
MSSDPELTTVTQSRYDRIAPFYDGVEVLAERRYRRWRANLWSEIKGPRVLEVGVGTGKNIPYYPDGIDITAIDFTPGMLERAGRRAARLNVDVDLRLGDAQNLDFADATFNEIVATFVYCSVEDPVRGLEEVARVLKKGGRVVMIEHVRSANPFAGFLMDVLNPVIVRVAGFNINRRTVKTVDRSPLRLERAEDLGRGDIYKLIVAQREN